jgi:tRNA A-37 threonylcarbamoyl transferase component Bud32
METIEALGKYEIKRPLGRGAMGTVYEGWDPIIARRVAIKTVRLPDASDPETEEALARFRREAQAAGRLTHPNIVGVFDYGETADLAYIVMEFVDGPPLKDVLDKHERFVLADIVRIMEDLLAGLQFSHERGVVHRDIKPANVMLTTSGQAKIADFGIARIESSSMTQAGTVLGTPAYMSPEQFMGQVVDARTDIYSSGVLLYQLLTGERPFEGGMSAIMHKALNTEPPAPSQLSVTAPPAFDAVVRRAMAKRPEDRFASATAFIEAVRTAVANPVEAINEDEATMVAAPLPGGTAVATPSIAVAANQPASRPLSPVAMMAVAGVVLLAALGGGSWWLLSRSSAPAQTAAIASPMASSAPTSTPTAAPSPSAPTPAPTPLVAIPPTPPATDNAATNLAPTAPATPAAPAAASPPIAAVPIVPPQPQVAPPVAPPTAPTATTPPAQVAAVLPAPVVAAPPAPVVATPPAPVIAAPPAPQPSPPVARADQQQLAMAGLESLRRQIAQWVSSQNCALLGGNVFNGGSINLSGLAAVGAVDGLRQGVANFAPPGQIDWRVNAVDPVFCPTLTALRPLVPAFGSAGGSRLGLQMADGKTRLHDGDPVRVQLVMPDFPARLRVDYIAHDGSVEHLYPQLADPKIGITADPPRVYSAGEPINLGHPSWTISEPYGTDMIIAIASSEPLFDRPRPGNAETLSVYLRDLPAFALRARRRAWRRCRSDATPSGPVDIRRAENPGLGPGAFRRSIALGGMRSPLPPPYSAEVQTLL